MNIAILTQPICNNYGGILQNYALQTVLERMGNTVTTLNYPISTKYSGSRIRHFLSTGKRLIQKIGGAPNIVWIDITKEARKQVELAHLQKQFLDSYLHLQTIDPPITKDQISKMKFDAFVVGSDQVWRPRYNQYIENMFLDFSEGMDVKRFAYAASLGTDRWEFSPGQTEKCTALAKHFDAISVRETSGIKLLKDHLGVDSIQVIDPTLLLSANDYLALCDGKEHPDGDYIAVYVLDITRHKLDLLNSVSKQLNCPIHFIGEFTKKGYPSVESWLEGIANAKYVITDSFHGTVFSIIFGKQFVTLGNAARGNDRFTSLFRLLSISDERFTSNYEKIVGLLRNPIDFFSIRCALNVQDVRAKQFLEQSLS